MPSFGKATPRANASWGEMDWNKGMRIVSDC